MFCNRQQTLSAHILIIDYHNSDSISEFSAIIKNVVRSSNFFPASKNDYIYQFDGNFIQLKEKKETWKRLPELSREAYAPTTRNLFDIIKHHTTNSPPTLTLITGRNFQETGQHELLKVRLKCLHIFLLPVPTLGEYHFKEFNALINNHCCGTIAKVNVKPNIFFTPIIIHDLAIFDNITERLENLNSESLNNIVYQLYLQRAGNKLPIKRLLQNIVETVQLAIVSYDIPFSNTINLWEIYNSISKNAISENSFVELKMNNSIIRKSFNYKIKAPNMAIWTKTLFNSEYNSSEHNKDAMFLSVALYKEMFDKHQHNVEPIYNANANWSNILSGPRNIIILPCCQWINEYIQSGHQAECSIILYNIINFNAQVIYQTVSHNITSNMVSRPFLFSLLINLILWYTIDTDPQHTIAMRIIGMVLDILPTQYITATNPTNSLNIKGYLSNLLIASCSPLESYEMLMINRLDIRLKLVMLSKIYNINIKLLCLEIFRMHLQPYVMQKSTNLILPYLKIKAQHGYLHHQVLYHNNDTPQINVLFFDNEETCKLVFDTPTRMKHWNICRNIDDLLFITGYIFSDPDELEAWVEMGFIQYDKLKVNYVAPGPVVVVLKKTNYIYTTARLELYECILPQPEKEFNFNFSHYKLQYKYLTCNLQQHYQFPVEDLLFFLRQFQLKQPLPQNYQVGINFAIHFINNVHPTTFDNFQNEIKFHTISKVYLWSLQQLLM